MAYISKRGSTWHVRYYVGRDPVTGKKIQRSKGGFRTKKEAERFEREVEASLDNNTYIEPTKITVKEYLEKWLEEYSVNLSPTTVAGYTRNIKNHTIPYIGHIPLQELQPIHIQSMYNTLQKEGRLDGKGGLSAKSVLYVHRTLNRALVRAKNLRMITQNPCEYVDTPKPEKYETEILSGKEVKKMLEVFYEYERELFIPTMLAVLVGLRRGEALGLQWENVFFEDKLLVIKNNYTYDDLNNKPILIKPKSENGVRIVAVSDNVADILKEQRKRQLELKLKFGQEYHESNFVCTKIDGRLFNPASFSQMFSRALKRHNLKHVRFHDLRHTNATLMLNSGVSAKVASERLGHSSITITLDLYSHVVDDLQRDAANKIDTNIFGNKKTI